MNIYTYIYKYLYINIYIYIYIYICIFHIYNTYINKIHVLTKCMLHKE